MTVLAIAAKELRLYFTSAVFWVIAAVFLVLCGYLFTTNVGFYVTQGGMNLGLGLWQWQILDVERFLVVLVPLLTMRLLAEERKLGTLELLWTYPVRDVEIIAGKYLACLAVVVVLLAATALHPLMLATIAHVDAGPLVAAYTGLLLLAAAFVACGLFASSVTDSQLVAGAAAYGLLFFFWIVTWNEAAMSEITFRLLLPLSLFDRFYAFARGAIDTQDVVYLVLFALVFLVFTFLALDARRWRAIR
jgi:ABC-2 type transport system permease protein